MNFEFKEVDRFVTGTVGEPGERQFFLQVRSANRLISAALEKSQAQTMAQRLDLLVKQVLKEDLTLRSKAPERDDLPLEQPIDSDFVVGAISITWDGEQQRIIIELYSINDSEDSINDSEEAEDADLVFWLTISQAQGFVWRTNAVVNAGRLPCPFCAIPIDPRGHLCPRANGYRR